MLHRAEVREGQHRHPWLDAEPGHELRGGGRDLREGFGVRVDVHRRVGEEESLLAENHHVDAADVLAPRLGADHLERRPQGIRIVDLLSGDQRVSASGPQHQQTVVHRIEHPVFRLSQGHAAPPAKLPQLLRELIAIGGGARIDELDLLERERDFVGLAADRVQITEQNRPRDALVRKNAGSAQDARVVAFGKYDTRRILLRAGDEAAHHLPLGTESQVMRGLISRAQQDPPSIVFPEGDDPRILRASRILADEGIARPVLLGDLDAIRRQADEVSLTLEEIELVNPRTATDRDELAQELWQRRRRRGMTLREAKNRVRDSMYYGLLMLRAGRTDALVAGEEIDYPDALRPALEVIGAEPGRKHVSGIYMMIFRQQTFFFADTTVNIDPDAETLAEIATATAKFVTRLGIEPRVAMLSFSNFGSVKHPAAATVQQAVAMLHEREPELQVDGEVQADTAVVERILTRVYPFAKLRSPA